MPNDDLLNQIERLAAMRPFLPGKVSQELGLEFVAVEEQNNPYFGVFEAQGEGLISRAELRAAQRTAEAEDGLLIIELNGDSGVTQDQVKTKFGDEPEFLPASPRQPADAPNYFVYRYPWGKISFGFSRDGEEKLTDVVIDATQD